MSSISASHIVNTNTDATFKVTALDKALYIQDGLTFLAFQSGKLENVL